MRSLGRAAALVAAVLGLAVAVLGVVIAAPAQAEVVFQVQTAATGAHFTMTQQPASSIVTASLVDDATAYTASAYDASGGSEAQSASVYPGNLVVQGPSLFCSQVFTCPAAPPAYPLLADASYPRRPTAQASGDQPPVGSGPLVVAPAIATAAASATGNGAQTSSGRMSVLAGTPVAMTVGASTSRTTVRASATSVIAHTEAAAHDVTVAGLVHIASVIGSDDVTLRPGHQPVDAPHITVSGVTIAGTAASIDNRGIHVAGHDVASLTRQLSRQGITIRTIGAVRTDTRTAARSDAAALDIEFSIPVSGTPYVPNPLPAPFDQVPGVNANGTYVGHLTLGAVGIVAGSNVLPAFSTAGFTPLPSTPGSSPVPGAQAAGGAPQLGPGTVTTPSQQSPQLAERPAGLRGFLDGFTTDLANLYAVLALGTGLLFIGWRGTVALRRWRPAAGRR